MAKKTKIEEAFEEMVDDGIEITEGVVENPMTPADMVLDQSMGKYNFVVVLGVNKNGFIDVNTSNNNLQNMSWIINRAAFKLNVYETSLEEKAMQAQRDSAAMQPA